MIDFNEIDNFVDTTNYMSREEIRQIFIDYITEHGLSELSMDDFWTVLRHGGAVLRGDTLKERRKNVYTALWNDARFQRVRPGVFSYKPGSPRKPRR